MAIEIRAMGDEDWQCVRAIYREGIATGQATFETGVPTWDSWNNGHVSSPRLVAITDGSVVGWAALSRVSAREVYAGVVEVSVYITEDARGHGVGRSLLEALIRQSEEEGFWMLQASIFPENEASIALHKSCGFREVGTRRRIAKLGGVWRDTVLLERRSKTAGID
jgi:L-amino acid N-acyltransferase YncA